MIDFLIRDYGAAGLFVVSFLAATLLPLSSEAALVLALSLGMKKEPALFWASAGNSLACLLNFALGRAGGTLAAQKIRDSRFGSIAWNMLHRGGGMALFLSWMPLIGDPITVLAGFVRIPLFLFVAVVLPLRVLRYVVIVLGF